MAKLTEYDAITEFSSDSDIIICDGDNGTKKMAVSDLAADLPARISYMQRRNTYRGAYLGSSLSDDQIAAIQAGTFDGMFIGDYWTINSVNYRIADMDYFYKVGDTSFTSHHLVIVPDTCLASGIVMNTESTTDGGYTGSEMYTTNMEDSKTLITTAFGDNVLTKREYLTNAVSSGVASSGAWFDSTIELLPEIGVYGCKIRSTETCATVVKHQFKLFELNPNWINIRANYWLRDVASSAYFCHVNIFGSATTIAASNTDLGVRPYFCIG